MASPDPEVPPLPLLMTLGATLAVSALTNCALLAALLKRHRNGLESLLVQISLADIAQSITKIIEIWTYNSGQWIYGTKACGSYKGFDVFFKTASIYLTIVLSMHSIALTNVEQKAIKLINENNDIEFEDEEKSSRHSLMASSDSSTPPRNMIIRRGISNSSSSVVVPAVFVWILAASLSFPEFILSTTTRASNGVEVCSLVDAAAFQIDVDTIISATFNLLLPTILISLTTVVVIKKLTSQFLIADPEVSVGLRLSLCLCVIFYVMCVFNLVVGVVYSYTVFVDNIVVARRLRPVGVASSAIYLLATIVRPCTIINVIPRLQKAFDLRPRTSIISSE